jgi:hypothetical protein
MVAGREAEGDEMSIVHKKEHCAHVCAIDCCRTIDDDTFANEHSAVAAKLAVGTTIDVVKAVMYGRAANGIALVRPPGHHAEADRPEEDGREARPNLRLGRCVSPARVSPLWWSHQPSPPRGGWPPACGEPWSHHCGALLTQCTTGMARRTCSTTTRACSTSRRTAPTPASSPQTRRRESALGNPSASGRARAKASTSTSAGRYTPDVHTEHRTATGGILPSG